ncbi:hypothetical protein AAG570_005945 [Ranatra chinensis]|uniref:Uncharacterized protein n=1 Tax=Ranatra chinensis TaxID=642074 RepID=A0ABD0YKA7_9HEMI
MVISRYRIGPTKSDQETTYHERGDMDRTSIDELTPGEVLRMYTDEMSKQLAFRQSLATIAFKEECKPPPSVYSWVKEHRSSRPLVGGSPVCQMLSRRRSRPVVDLNSLMRAQAMRKKGLPGRRVTFRLEEFLDARPYDLKVNMIKAKKPINILYNNLVSRDNVKHVLITIKNSIYRTSMTEELSMIYNCYVGYIGRAERDLRDIDPEDDIILVRISTLQHEIIITPSKLWMILVVQETKDCHQRHPPKMVMDDSGQVVGFETPPWRSHTLVDGVERDGGKKIP